MTHAQLSWMQKVRVGSILRNKRGTDYRVVRAVSRYKNGDLCTITLAIRVCSWTSRPYTVLFSNDLIQRGYSLIEGVRVKLDRGVDRLIERSFSAKRADLCPIRCYQVKGVP